MTTTYARKSRITPEMIQSRMSIADRRVRAAALDMVARLYSRADFGALPPDDMDSLALPHVPPIPASVLAVAMCPREHSVSARRELPLDARTRDSLGCTVRENATPTQIVTAIRDADAYAAEFERLAAQYESDTALAIEAHTDAHAGAVLDLIELVGQRR